MVEKFGIKIFDLNANKYVEAVILPITDQHIEEIDSTWKPQLISQNAWDKNFNPSDYLDCQELYQVSVLECNNSAQGLIAFERNPRCSQVGLNEGLIYIRRLKSAPTNRFSCHQRTYRGVGVVLIVYAILASIEMGFNGRLGLSSVKESEGFYQNLGFAYLGCEFNNLANKPTNLKYYELGEENAELILLNFSLLVEQVSLSVRGVGLKALL